MPSSRPTPRIALWLCASLCALGLWSCQRSSPPTPSPAQGPGAQAKPADLRSTDTQPPVRVDFSRRGAQAVTMEVPRQLSPAAFCPLYAQVVCRKIFACAEPESIAADAAQLEFQDEPGCQSAMGRFCGAFVLAHVEDAVQQGRVSWDGGRFSACFSHWVELGCTGPLGDLPGVDACRSASRGQVQPGGLCTSAFDCAPVPGQENVCITAQDAQQGTCRLLGQPGEPCQDSGQCRGDLRCVQDKCAPPGPQGAPCVFDQDCAPGLRCPDQDQRCTP